MLLPVFAAAKRAAQVKKATLEMQGIVTAIQGYDSAYGRFPVSSQAQSAASQNVGNAASTQWRFHLWRNFQRRFRIHSGLFSDKQ